MHGETIKKIMIIFLLVLLILTIRGFILNILMFFRTISAGQQINIICLDPKLKYSQASSFSVQQLRYFVLRNQSIWTLPLNETKINF
jgi:hypothetical protein